MADSLFEKEEDFLAELTGPGGKYDRTKFASEAEMYQAIAKGKVHADRMIEHKNSDMDQLREDYLKEREENATKAKLDDYLKRLESNTDVTARTNADKTIVEPQLDETKVKQLLAQQLQELKIQEREEANMAVVESRLRETFGADARTVIGDKMKSLNLSPEDMKFLARKSPEAVINALGLSQRESFMPPTSNTRSDNFKREVETRDAVYYDKLRKENPKEYFKEKISVQRLKDMSHPDFMKRWNEQQARAAYL